MSNLKVRSSIGLIVLACGLGTAASAGCRTYEGDDRTEVPTENWTYERVVRFDGLDEDVTVKKSRNRYVGVRYDGSLVPIEQLKKADREAKLAKFGALDPILHARLSSPTSSATAPVSVGVLFRNDVQWGQLRQKMRAKDAGAKQQAHREALDGLATARTAAVRAIEATGLRVVSAPATFSGLVATGTPEQILRAARAPEVIRIVDASQRPATKTTSPPKNGVSDPGIDNTFNADGLYGLGQKIAIIEDNGQGLWEPHESFVLAEVPPFQTERVAYKMEPKDCDDDSECDIHGGGSGLCLDLLYHPNHDKQCVTVHASQMASVILGTVGGTPHGAARARMYYANGDNSGNTNLGNPAALLEAYQFLASEFVTTVLEAWTTRPSNATNYYGATLEGITQDWYARYYDMAIFKSAGNRDYETLSDLADAACPFSLNSTCVGSHYESGAGVSYFSSASNLNGAFGARTDREEPDVTTFGGGSEISGDDVEVMQLGDDDDWDEVSGTSPAAAIATTMAALCKEASGGSRSALSIRAIFKAGAWERNPGGGPPADYRYSTTTSNFTPTNDWLDGAGGLTGAPLLAQCKGNGNALDGAVGVSGEDPGELKGDAWSGGSTCDRCGSSTPLGGQSVQVRSYTNPSSSDGREFRTVLRTDLTAGNRLRIAIAWDSCPASDSGTASAPVTTDYDLFLVDPNGDAIYSSQSISDVTEGFDVTLPAGSATGTYEVKLGFPANSPGCSSFTPGFEPFAVSVWAWGPTTAPTLFP